MITPPGGTVLDPFMGSGTTGVASLFEDFKFLGIEKDEKYFAIAKKRIFGVQNQKKKNGGSRCQKKKSSTFQSKEVCVYKMKNKEQL